MLAFHGWSRKNRRSRRLVVAGACLAVLAAIAVVGVGAALGGGDKKGSVAGEWALPGADLQNTRNVPGSINSSNVKSLKLAWRVAIRAKGTFGTYATTPVVVGGVVYTQDINSNVYAIDLASGKVKWFHRYNSPSVGPNGVNVVNGVVYGATGDSAFALQASTGEQLWKKKLTRNKNEGIDMAPGVNDGTVYISTVPGNSKGFYVGNGQAILWAMNAKTGATLWKWEEVPTNLWSNKHTDINSGGGQWDPPSFDANGDLYIGVSNPAPWPGVKGLPFATSRPGPNLYTDSVVKLDHTTGKLIWYYQLTPHDLYDWDLENSPILGTVNGKGVVFDGGKAGIVIALDQETGKLLWKKKVGIHNGHDNDNLLPLSRLLKKKFPYLVYPGALGGIESQLAYDGKRVFAVANNLPGTYTSGYGFKFSVGFDKGTGELVALDQASGALVCHHHFDSSPYGAVSLTNDVAFTTTFDGTVWALNSQTCQLLWHKKLPAGTNTPVTIAGDTVVTAGSFPTTKTQVPAIVAYRLP